MKNQRLLLFGYFLLLCVGMLHAQELKVSVFQRMNRDLYARTHERLDLNENPCAVVRVSIPDAKSYTFEGNIIGDIDYKPGEAIVYMTAGSRNITIRSDKFGSMRYEFTQKLEKNVVYKLVLRLEETGANKRRTLVTPVMGIGESYSYGLMVAVVKKFGWYVKAKYDFKTQETTAQCTNEGNNLSGEPLWFTGNTAHSRLAVTTGAMIRLAKPLYLFAGAGYGYKKTAWEMAEGEYGYEGGWAENTDETFDGVEADLGLVLRLGNIALTAGAQTNQFKYYEATVGLGIMF